MTGLLQNNFTKYLKTDNMENTNLSEEAIAIKQLDADIEDLTFTIEQLQNQLTIKESKLNQLKERKKSLLNYLNTDNN